MDSPEIHVRIKKLDPVVSAVVKGSGPFHHARAGGAVGLMITNGNFYFGFEVPGKDDFSPVPGDHDGASLNVKGLAVGADSKDFDGQAERNAVAASIEVQLFVQINLPSEPYARPGGNWPRRAAMAFVYTCAGAMSSKMARLDHTLLAEK